MFCVFTHIYFLSIEQLKTCASQPRADVAPTSALTHPPTFLPSFPGELANNYCLNACAAQATARWGNGWGRMFGCHISVSLGIS